MAAGPSKADTWPRPLDFETSTHVSRWLLSPQEVAESEARHAFGSEPLNVSRAKLLYTQYLSALGRRARVRQRAIATAVVYFRRFYHRFSFLQHDPLLIAPTALWVASKVEECALQAKVLVNQLAHLELQNPYQARGWAALGARTLQGQPRRTTTPAPP